MLGPRIGKKVQECIQLAKEGKWKEKNGIVVIGDFELNEGEYEIETVINDDPFLMAIDCENRLFSKLPVNGEIKQVKNWENPINDKLIKKTIMNSCSY